jgi:hypothetical protein
MLSVQAAGQYVDVVDQLGPTGCADPAEFAVGRGAGAVSPVVLPDDEEACFGECGSQGS